MKFTEQQPKDGDTILHCGHVNLETRPAHWFKYERVFHFERPDKTRGAAEWLAICETCFQRYGANTPVRGDGRWTGDAPVITREDN